MGVAIRSVAAVPGKVISHAIMESLYLMFPAEALSIPTSGKYRILNIGTGLFLDAFESEQSECHESSNLGLNH